jgi:hypothetical protein
LNLNKFLNTYSVFEVDSMLHEIKKESSNFLTREDAERLIHSRPIIIDPPHCNCNCRQHLFELQGQFDDLKFKFDCLLAKLDKVTEESVNINKPPM